MAQSIFSDTISVEVFKQRMAAEGHKSIGIYPLTADGKPVFYNDENGNPTTVQTHVLRDEETLKRLGSVSRKVAMNIIAKKPHPKVPVIGISTYGNRETGELETGYSLYYPGEMGEAVATL